MASKKENAIDPGLFGALLRHERQEQGYSTAEEFAAAITEMTGYSVSKETIYKIESGKQEPKLSLFMAIKFLLFPNEKPSLGGDFDVSLPSYWQHPIEGYYDESADIFPDGSVYVDIPKIAQREAKRVLEVRKDEEKKSRSSRSNGETTYIVATQNSKKADDSGSKAASFSDNFRKAVMTEASSRIKDASKTTNTIKLVIDPNLRGIGLGGTLSKKTDDASDNE